MGTDRPQVEMSNRDREFCLRCRRELARRLDLFWVVVDVRMEIADRWLGHVPPLTSISCPTDTR
jgi:hypothetical protein